MGGIGMELVRAKELLKKMGPTLKEFKNDSDMEYDFENKDERFEAAQLRKIANHLSEAAYLYEYMKKPIVAEGFLTKRIDGRYEIEGTSYYFTSGSQIENWDDEDQCYYLTRIEHQNDDYYAVNSPNEKLEGMKVRKRGL